MGDKYTPTTTHAEWGAGRPRLIVTGDDDRREVELREDLVRIGSADHVEISLDGLEVLHAEIHHDPYDEYVLVVHGPAETSAQHEPVDSIGGRRGEVLRTGARFVLAGWTFVYARDEYADHGLPYGGRQGGEGAEDPHQPPRPDYTGSHPIIRDDAS